MLPFTKNLIDMTENINSKTMGEVKQFAATIDAEKNKTVEALREEIRLIEQNTQKFLVAATSLKVKQTEKSVIKTIGNVTIMCPLIAEAYEANYYPHRPCCIAGVEDWYFIAFPHLRQVLPVTFIKDPLLGPFSGTAFTRLDENMFTKKFYESLGGTNFAVIPFTVDCWKKMMMVDKKKWSTVLHQMNVCHRRNLLAIDSTTFLAENAKRVKPCEMAPQWSLMVQLYFLLYLFAKEAPDEHFCLN
jgi:hypothetical protein